MVPAWLADVFSFARRLNGTAAAPNLRDQLPVRMTRSANHSGTEADDAPATGVI